MTKRLIWGSVIWGMITGIILGLVLKWLEGITEKKVYTLLLNVDYIPIINTFKLSELMEFNLHLIISIILAILLSFLILKYRLQKKFIVPFVTVTSLMIGFLLFPTTALSERTPSITDLLALLYWQIGHLSYGLTLGLALFFLLKNHTLLNQTK
jgi:hypothetical protein